MTIDTIQYAMSPTIGKLAEALALAQSEITGAVKDSNNPFYKSKYADLSNVLDAMKPCHKHGLSLIQMPLEGQDCVRLITTLAHSSGEWMQAVYSMKPEKNNPQGIGSCLTYMRRYAAAAFVGIAQIDDDANEASNKSEDAKKNSHKHLPNDGAWDEMSDEQQKKLQIIADKIEEFMAENNLEYAVGMIKSNEMTQEEKRALWTRLDSATRTAINAAMGKGTPKRVEELRGAVK